MTSERTPMLVSPADGLAAQIVSAYVSNNHIPQDDVGPFFAKIRTAVEASTAPVPPKIEMVTPKTGKEIKASITPDFLISFVDGKPYKMLKRHLKSVGLTPHEYRQKYGLPADYPLTAPSYSEQRADLARKIGLGRVS